jgi:hypothetical protein
MGMADRLSSTPSSAVNLSSAVSCFQKKMVSGLAFEVETAITLHQPGAA